MEIIKLSKETEDYINKVKRQMEQLGVLEEVDKDNLDLLGSQVELYIRSMKDLDEKGLTCVDQKNRVVANPSFSISRSCITQITALLKELSLSCRQRRLLTRDSMIDDSTPLDDFVDKVGDLF